MKRIAAILLMVILVSAISTAALASEEGKLLIWADKLRSQALADIVKAFTEEYGVPVEVQEIAFGDIRDNLAIAGPAGEGPDILVGAHDWLGQLVQSGLIEPIDLGGRESEFVPVAIRAFTTAGSLYAVPYGIDSIGLFYNKALIPTPPETFDQVYEICRTLNNKETGTYGFLLPQPDPYHTFPLLSATGGYVFGTTEDGSLNPYDIGLNNAGAVRGLEVFSYMIKEGLMPGNIDYTTMTTLFKEGKLGMMITGPWAIPDIKGAGIDYGFTAIPKIDGQNGKPFVGAQGFMISAFSKNKALAQIFLSDFVATNETMLALYKADARPTAFLAATEVVNADPDMAGIYASAEKGIPMPSIPQMSAVWESWTEALQLVINGTEEPKQALDEAVVKIKNLIGPQQ